MDQIKSVSYTTGKPKKSSLRNTLIGRGMRKLPSIPTQDAKNIAQEKKFPWKRIPKPGV